VIGTNAIFEVVFELTFENVPVAYLDDTKA